MESSDDDVPLSMIAEKAASNATKLFVIPKKSKQAGANEERISKSTDHSGANAEIASKSKPNLNKTQSTKSKTNQSKLSNGKERLIAKERKNYKDLSDEEEMVFKDSPISKKRKASDGKKKNIEEEVSDSANSEDDFVEKKPKVRQPPAKKTTTKTSLNKSKPAQDSSRLNGTTESSNGSSQMKAERMQPKTFKSSTKVERLEQAMKAYKWWEEPPLAPGRQWNYFEHCGMSFPDEYQPHGIRLLYDGEEIDLEPEDEEIATFFADMPLDGPQLGDVEMAKVFSMNFFADWQECLAADHPLKGGKFEKCDFSAMRNHQLQKKLIKKAATDEERARAKEEKEQRFHRFGLAVVDGHLEKVGNFTMEPPGLFRGRGKHPKTGKVKRRGYPNQVTINIGEAAKIPQCPIPGFAWKSVQHDPGVAWLSTWKENVLGMNKYAMLAASSSFKGKSDMEKYNKAMRLKGYIATIRRDYEAGLGAATRAMRQLATAMWLIDKLALRVGGEKDSGEEADTVGCCTLRIEHLTFGASGAREIELEFLGKDSMLFKQNIDFDEHGDIGKKVFDNLRTFCNGKSSSEQVFSDIDPIILNRHLQSLMPGLSAKVFRTYNASETLQDLLPSFEKLSDMTVQAKVVEYNNANREVSILCNHQKTVSSAAMRTFENFADRVAKVKEQRSELKQWLRWLQDGKDKKIPLKGQSKNQIDIADEEEEAKKALEQAKNAKANATTSEEKVRATKLAEVAAQKRRDLTQRKFEESHLYSTVPSKEQLTKKIETWTTKLKKLEVDLRDKDQNKEVSLGTAKINYMDPRISVAWCKRNEIPIERIFAKTLRDKFVWAMSVPPDWRFDFETLQQATHEAKKEGF